jgi:hypothetical protein
MQIQILLSDYIQLGKSTRQGITLMGLSLGFVLLFKVFDFLLEKLDFTCALQLYFIQLMLHFNPLVDLLFNLPVFGLQLVESIFHGSQLV